MNAAELIQYISYALMAIGALAFLVSIVVQAVKEMPGLARIQTNAVALAVSLVMCPAVVTIACQLFGIALTWYYLLASLIAAFLVYLVSTGGWERVYRMWERTRYRKGDDPKNG